MLRAIESAPHTSRQATSSACHIAYAACSQRACAGCSMCVYADFQSALSPISPSLRSSCPRCSESMGERHWAHAWAQAVVGVLQSSRHLGRHCRVQHQQPQIAANSVHHAHPHLDSTTHTIKNFRAGGAESPSRTRNYRRAGGEIPRNYQVGWWTGSGGCSWMLSCSSRPATEAAKNWPVS